MYSILDKHSKVQSIKFKLQNEDLKKSQEKLYKLCKASRTLIMT